MSHNSAASSFCSAQPYLDNYNSVCHPREACPRERGERGLVARGGARKESFRRVDTRRPGPRFRGDDKLLLFAEPDLQIVKRAPRQRLLSVAAAGAVGQIRKEAEIHVHRLECLGGGAAGDMAEQGAKRCGERGR